MKRLYFFATLTIVLFGLANLSAQSASNAPNSDIKIFAINLASTSVDLSLGLNDAVFKVQALAPNTASKMIVLKKPGAWQLYYAVPNATTDSPRNADGQAYLYTLQSAKTYVLRFIGSSAVDVFEVMEPSTSNAKIAFVNNSSASVGQFQVGTAFGQNTLVSLKDLPAHEHSNFGSINFAATYGVFWTTGSTNGTLSDANDKPIANAFTDNSYWVFILKQDASKNAPTGSLFNVTP